MADLMRRFEAADTDGWVCWMHMGLGRPAGVRSHVPAQLLLAGCIACRLPLWPAANESHATPCLLRAVVMCLNGMPPAAMPAAATG